MIGMAKPQVGEEEIAAVVDVMRSGQLAAGPKVNEFEQAFASYIGAKEGVASCNGTTALHVALLALGVQPGDKVLTTPFTFIASSNSILFNQATPVFVDINPSTFLLDPDKLEAYLEKNYEPSMKAIMVVHLFGLACDMDRIMSIANKYKLKVIEDCAQAHGAEFNGVKAGSFGDASSFSFYPTKNMTTGEGGITLFKDSAVANLARKFVNHGRVDQYLHDVLGYNYRLTSIAAVIGLAQLKKVDGFNKNRIHNAAIYDKELSSVDGVVVPSKPAACKHVYHQYTIRVDAGKRGALQQYMKDNDIGSAVVYPFSMNQQPCYEGVCEYEELSIAEEVSGEVLSIPVHPALVDEDIFKVVQVITSFFQGAK